MACPDRAELYDPMKCQPPSDILMFVLNYYSRRGCPRGSAGSKVALALNIETFGPAGHLCACDELGAGFQGLGLGLEWGHGMPPPPGF